MLLGLNLDGVKIHMLVRKTLGKQIAQEKYRGWGGGVESATIEYS